MKAELKSWGSEKANGATMHCDITLTMPRTEKEYVPDALKALDEAYQVMKKTLKEWMA